jgi:hypothetical protein
MQMKRKLLSLSSLLIISFIFSPVCFGQNNFEGHITYNAVRGTKDSSIKFMDVYFKKDKLRIDLTKDSVDETKFSQYIYDLKKGIYYEISPEKKLIVTNSLKEAIPYGLFTYDLQPGLSKKILGHYCEGYHITSHLFKSTGLIDIKAWFPNDIKCYVPGGLQYINPRIFFNKEAFSLEVQIITDSEDIEAEEKDTLSIKAVSIENKIIADTVFQLNKKFTVKTLRQYQKEHVIKFTPPKIVADEPTKKIKPTGAVKPKIAGRKNQ